MKYAESLLKVRNYFLSSERESLFVVHIEENHVAIYNWKAISRPHIAPELTVAEKDALTMRTPMSNCRIQNSRIAMKRGHFGPINLQKNNNSGHCSCRFDKTATWSSENDLCFESRSFNHVHFTRHMNTWHDWENLHVMCYAKRPCEWIVWWHVAHDAEADDCWKGNY